MAKKKYAQTTSAPHNAIEDANSEVEALAEEMREWCSNIEEKFSGTEQYERVSTAADELESVEAPDPSASEECDDTCTFSLVASKRMSRADRRDNAAARYAAACDILRGAAEGLREKVAAYDKYATRAENYAVRAENPPVNAPDGWGETERDEAERTAEGFEELADACEEAQSTIEGVEFPGMFGR